MKGTLTYTQHTVAFPTLPADPQKDWVKDGLCISDDADGGGTHGEFHIEFMEFSGGIRGVQVQVFGDGLDTFYDKAVQRAIRRWRETPTPDDATPDDFIRWLAAEGAVASRYHTSTA